MADFSSSTFQINCTNTELSDYLGQPANLVEILPADRIEDWKTEGDSCSFKIKGLAHISLKLAEKSASKVVYSNTSEKPFPFNLIINTKDAGNNSTSLDAAFDADVNSFMGMMLKGPLSAFLNSLGEAIQKRY